jgi:hypothetical protein
MHGRIYISGYIRGPTPSKKTSSSYKAIFTSSTPIRPGQKKNPKR